MLVRFITVALVCLFVLLTSCSQVPQPTGYSASNMHKMQSVGHWDVLAGDLARQLCLNLSPNKQQDQVLYIVPQEGVFYATFNRLLTAKLTRLAAQGSCLPVTVDPVKGLHVEIEAQVVRHRADRINRPPLGAITLLGAGIRVARDIGESLIIPAALLIDLGLGSWDSLPHNEVVITTSVLDRDRYLFVQSDLYYINDSDTWHYLTPEDTQSSPVRSFSARGDEQP